MDKFHSKQITHSIDVSTNNNYVMILNGIPISISFILNNLIQNIIREIKKMVINVTLISIIDTMLLKIFIVSLIFLLFIRDVIKLIGKCSFKGLL
jgi:hypothetical protein